MEDEKEQPRCFIAIEFTDPGSSLFKIIPENVSPMQLLMVGEYLSFTAKNQILMQEKAILEQREQMKIQVPEGTLRRH